MLRQGREIQAQLLDEDLTDHMVNTLQNNTGKVKLYGEKIFLII